MGGNNLLRNIPSTDLNLTLQNIPIDTKSLRSLRRYLKYDFSYITGPLFFMFALAMKKGKIRGVYLTDGKKDIGYAIVKNYPELNLIHVEFLAILPEYRSDGFGSIFIEKLINHLGNLILEVEDPDLVQNNQAEFITRTRRIRFYERNGLQLDPDLKFNHAGYPLRVMSNIHLPKVDWLKIFRSSYNQLYGLPIAHLIFKARS